MLVFSCNILMDVVSAVDVEMVLTGKNLSDSRQVLLLYQRMLLTHCFPGMFKIYMNSFSRHFDLNKLTNKEIQLISIHQASNNSSSSGSAKWLRLWVTDLKVGVLSRDIAKLLLLGP